MAKIGMLTRQKRRAREEDAPTHEYEVRCYSCDVSFPPETRKCMYCGGRPGAQALFTPAHHPEPLESYGPPADFGQPLETRPDAPQTLPNAFDDEEEERPETPRGMLLRMLGSMSWVLLFIAVSIYRSCAG